MNISNLITNEVLLALGTGWLGLAVAAISPGPNMFAVVAASLGGGLAKGLQVNLGIALGALAWAALINLGLATLFINYPLFVQIFAFLGGAYLLFLSSKGFRSAFSNTAAAMIDPDEQRSALKNILHGLAVTFSNPKVALFWASISGLITSVTTDWGVLVVFALGASLVVFIIYGSYALAFSWPAFREIYKRFRRVADGLFGVVFMGLALVILAKTFLWS